MNEQISQSDFEYVSKLVKQESAITLEKGKEYLVQSRLEPVAKSLGLVDIKALVESIKNDRGGDLKRKVVESLTTHETSFFRDIEPFEALRTRIFPKLIESRKKDRQLTIWCGAASSGQEPYSLAILIKEHFPELLGWKFKFIATDVSRQILEKAKSGVFSQIEVNRGLAVRLLMKYFTKQGQDWIIHSELRNMIEFTELNLLHSFVKIPQADLIMMRNVLIYFDIESKKQILAKVRSLMRPDAYMFLGTAETTINIDEQFERVAFDKTSCYQVKKT